MFIFRAHFLAALVVCCMFLAAPSLAQTGFDASGQHGIMLGYDGNDCESSIAGAIRYNSGGGGTCPSASGDFEYDTDDNLDRTYSTNPSSTSQATLSLWIKRESVGQYEDIVIVDGLTGSYTNLALLADNTLVFSIADSPVNDIAFTAGTITDTSWHHILVQIDLTQGVAADKAVIYKDGIDVTSYFGGTGTVSSFGTSLFGNGEIHAIGGHSGSDTFDGLMAEIHAIDGSVEPLSSFYNAGSAVQYSGAYGNNGFHIGFNNSGNLGEDSSGNGHNFTNDGVAQNTADYPTCSGGGGPAVQVCLPSAGAPTSGLISHWEFEDGTGSSTAADSVGTNDGTLNNMDVNTDWVSGQIGGALDFDGSNDWVTITNDASLEFGASQDFSISFWYYNHDNSGYWDIIDKMGASYGYICNFSFGLGSGGVECYFDGTSSTATVYSASSAVPLQDTWYHITVTADRDGNAQIYVNGSASGSAVDISGVGNIDSSSNLYFGVHHGQLDDVRFYDRVLSTSEITELYDCGVAGDCSAGGGWTNWGE